MLLKKGVYPYDWMDDLIKLNTTKVLSKDNFYNNLTKEHTPDEEYQHNLKVMDKLFTSKEISRLSWGVLENRCATIS